MSGGSRLHLHVTPLASTRTPFTTLSTFRCRFGSFTLSKPAGHCKVGSEGGTHFFQSVMLVGANVELLLSNSVDSSLFPSTDKQSAISPCVVRHSWLEPNILLFTFIPARLTSLIAAFTIAGSREQSAHLPCSAMQLIPPCTAPPVFWCFLDAARRWVRRDCFLTFLDPLRRRRDCFLDALLL